jgi:GAF domain-containing protein
LPWLAALHRINRAATANLELTEMLETSVRVLAETTGADACAVLLYDEASDSLALRAALGLNAALVGAVTIRPGIGITGVAAAERRVVAAPDQRSHPSYQPFPATGEDLYASQVSVPMLTQRGGEPDRLVGVVNILTVSRREFAEDEIAFLQTVAGRAGDQHRQRPPLQPDRRPPAAQDRGARDVAAGVAHAGIDARPERRAAADRRAGDVADPRRSGGHLPLPRRGGGRKGRRRSITGSARGGSWWTSRAATRSCGR